jgi:hypothetical protein
MLAQLAVCLPLVLATAPPAGDLEIGRRAPDLGLSAWLEPTDAKPRAPEERAGELAPDERSRVAAYHGVPLVVHTLAWGDPTSTDAVLPLMRALVDACSDRGIAIVGVANGGGDDALERELAELERHRVRYPVARAEFGRRTGPYVDVATHGLAYAFVVGPNGALLWEGNPAADEEGFLAAVQAAYARPVVAPLDAPLHAELAGAEVAYLAADLRNAEARARRVADSEDPDVALGAAEILRLIDATADGWLRAARSHGDAGKDGGPDLRYAEAAAWIRTALERKPAEKELGAIEDELVRRKGWRAREQELGEWLELRPDRPALFPARVTKAGDAHAKKLAKLLRSLDDGKEEARAARDLLQRYEQARLRED